MGDTWTKTVEIYNESNVLIPFFDRSQTNRLEVILASPTAGGLSLQGFLGELGIEETDNTGTSFRLHSTEIWSSETNPLSPIAGEVGVKITQDVPGNTITLSCLVDGTMLTESNQNVYVHAYI